MTWLSLLTTALAASTVVSALPSPHDDLKWVINNRRGLDKNQGKGKGSDSGPGKGNNPGKGNPGKGHGKPSYDELTMCSAAGDHVVPGPKDNIWLDLTNDDVKGLMAYLHDPQQGLNLTEYAKAGPWDNHM